MTTPQAEDLVDHAKGLFRFMTPYQGKALLARLCDFPDERFAREALEYFATHKPPGAEDWQEGNIPLAAIRERLDAEHRRLREGEKHQAFIREQQAAASKQAYRERVAARIAEMTDEDLALWKKLVLADLKPTAAAFMEKHDPRTNGVLQGLIYEAERTAQEVSA